MNELFFHECRAAGLVFKTSNDWCKWLTDEQLGQLTRAIFLYARDGETISLEPVVRMAFGFIVDDMKRNKAKYEEKAERWRANGKKGGRPSKNQEDKQKPIGLDKNQEVFSKTKQNQLVFSKTKQNQLVFSKTKQNLI